MTRWCHGVRRGFRVPLGRGLLALALVVGVLDAPTFAQVGGANVGGVVTDETGGRLPGVTITITNKANGRVVVLVTGEEGNYRAVALQPAPYEITAELSGFGTAKREVTLNVGTDVTVDFRLGIQTIQETITVAGGTPLVEVNKSQPSSVVAAEQIQSLPILSRNFLELAQLLPGAGPQNGPQSFVTTKFGGVADQRNGFSTVIDGGTLDDAIWGATITNVTQDAVQEFTVFRNQFDAQYGTALTAVVTVATKSGTNDLHGTGFYFGRGRRLNARNPFAKTNPPFDQQRVGGTLGGPVAQNRTHFFGAYEYLNVDTVKVIALPPTNPAAANENGIFPSGMSDQMGVARVDHRFSETQSMFARYLYDNQYILRELNPTSDSRQLDEFNKTHSLVAEHNWILSNNKVNTLRFHYLNQRLGLLPHSDETSIIRPSIQTGSVTHAPQFFPRTHVTVAETLFINKARHSLKLGGDLRFFKGQHESYWDDQGTFFFGTDAAFDPNNLSTWPYAFTIQKPGLWTFTSQQIALYAQDDWRVANNVRLNLGVRYDLDTKMRHNEFYQELLDNPRYAGIENFVRGNRGNDYDNLQPRLGVTWDTRGDGSFVLRGGFGVYTTRNREWFQLTTQDRAKSVAVRIEEPARLRFFPDINTVLGGQSLEAFLASGGARPLVLISDDYVLPYSLNTTVGFGWRIDPRTSLTVDYVHTAGRKELGATDYNLPPTGRISASNPRPVGTFTEVKIVENFTRSWYDALETQLRTRLGRLQSLQVSYTLSRAYRDGVNHYQTYRGTMRTPQERGYSENDTRHNLSMAGSMSLPWGFELSGILRAISGSPILVQAGFDTDGDGQSQGDRPRGVPITVGRDRVDESLRLINELRATRGLPPISRELLQLDPYITLDLRATKALRLDVNQRVELFLEAYNVTNHVNYEPFSVSSNIIARDFMARRSARIPRQIQWGVRYLF